MDPALHGALTAAEFQPTLDGARMDAQSSAAEKQRRLVPRCDGPGALVAHAQPPAQRLSGVAAHRDLAHAPSLALEDRKSTRLNSSHVAISYAVFCSTKK